MPEQCTYTNATFEFGPSHTVGGPKHVLRVYSSPGAVSFQEYDLDEWDVCVPLTRKLPPIPDGTLALYGELIYAKRSGQWFAAVNPGHQLATETLDRFDPTRDTDDYIRAKAKLLAPSDWPDA